jgi:hypothetical protein
MIGCDAVMVRREFLSRLSAGLLAISSILAIPSPFWASAEVLASPLGPHLSEKPIQAANPSTRLILPVTNSGQDPLQSPFPLPWHLIEQQQAQATKLNRSALLKYATTPLRSPDGQVVAASEIDVRISPDFRQSHIFSQLVLKTAQGKSITVIPSSMHLSQSAVDETAARDLPGTVAILVPAAWSPDGQKLLSRQFEAVFGSDVSSDYAVIWDRNQQLTKTVSPLPLNYDSATLLGWNPKQPSQVLFNTTILGEKEGTVLAVDYRSNTVASPLTPGKTPSIHYGQAFTAPRQ